ncbi:MAG: MotA/TolQ/ExbB proton channel family protein [Puniceicoccales bacterium]|jgi:biopolymer transport protein ExbB|nr:MotA/TolQ/ExbB proton channel family protein [Puniceicoccales bacterium]
MKIFSSDFLFFGDGLMLLLIVVGIIAIAVFIERLLFLKKCKINAQIFVDGIKVAVKEGRIIEAITLCEENTGSVANVIKIALVNAQEKVDSLERIMKDPVLLEISSYESNVGVLRCVAKIAPMIGMIGVAMSFLHIFDKINDANAYVGASLFSSEITTAIALISAGLGVAVFSNLGYHLIHGIINGMIYDLEWTYNEMIQFLSMNKSK